MHDFLKSIKECGRAGALCFVFRAVCLLVAYVGRIPGPLMWSGGPVSAVEAGTSVPCMWAEVIKVTVLKGGGGGGGCGRSLAQCIFVVPCQFIMYPEIHVTSFSLRRLEITFFRRHNDVFDMSVGDFDR